MADHKLTRKQVKALEAQIKSDQEKPIRENERRVRIDGSFKVAIKRMTKTQSISNKALVEWNNKQKKDAE